MHRNITRILENHMEEKIENEIDTGMLYRVG